MAFSLSVRSCFGSSWEMKDFQEQDANFLSRLYNGAELTLVEEKSVDSAAGSRLKG